MYDTCDGPRVGGVVRELSGGRYTVEEVCGERLGGYRAEWMQRDVHTRTGCARLVQQVT